MKQTNNLKKSWLVTAFFVTTILVGSIVIVQDNIAYAGGDKKKKSNEAEQGISQIQGLDQASTVGSGNNSIASGNNVGLLLNLNEGNNALGQQ
jgi:hypothetical protein